jgi:hypothetical protein
VMSMIEIIKKSPGIIKHKQKQKHKEERIKG